MHYKMVVYLLSVILLMCSCSSSSVFKSYPSQVEPCLNSVSQNVPLDYETLFQKQIQGNDGVLYAMEEGRLQQIQSYASDSLENYNLAIEMIKEADDKAVISASGVGAQGGAVALNDNAIPYSPDGYERIVLRQLQSMNYLAKGDVQGACVEIRAANNEHKVAKAKHEKEMLKAEESVEEAKQDTDVSEFQETYVGMNSVVGDVKSSFLNAYTFYYSGLVYELSGSPNDAYIDYKQALEIAPNNTYIQRDVFRLAKQLDMREDFERFRKKYTYSEVTSVGLNMGTLVVFFEDGFVKQKSSIGIPIPYFSAGAIVPITAPIYTEPWRIPKTLEMSVSGAGTFESLSICSVTDLAIKSLQEELPMVLSRIVIRAFAKATVAKQLSDSLGAFGSLAASAYNIVTESADLRSWLSLPDNVQLIRTYVTPGTHELQFRIDGGCKTHAVDIKANKPTIVRVIKTNDEVYVLTLY